MEGAFRDREEHNELRGAGELVITLKREFGGSRILKVEKRNLCLT